MHDQEPAGPQTGEISPGTNPTDPIVDISKTLPSEPGIGSILVGVEVRSPGGSWMHVMTAGHFFLHRLSRAGVFCFADPDCMHV